MNQDTMHKRIQQSLALLLLATLTACESTDLPIQHADSYDYITFSAQAERLATRTNPYENYDSSKHPQTMGVFGYYDSDKTIFNNDKVTYSGTSWNYDTPKKWDDYKGATSFDFFAYMPQVADAKVTQNTDGTYALSFPFTIPAEKTSGETNSEEKASPLFYDVRQAPIICNKPVHRQATDASGKELAFERLVNFQFDQTMTAYQLWFQLDNKMSAIRQFRIKSVTLSGKLATSCTVSRTYSLQEGGQEWTAGDIQWKDIQYTTFDTNDTKPFEISNKGDNGKEELVVTSSKFSPWGSTFYTIPDASFQPTISVTYDTEFLDQDGKTVVTRKDVTSTIVLNKNNFNTLATNKTAIINPIRILIQPRYLYVLADDDAYTGHLLIE